MSATRLLGHPAGVRVAASSRAYDGHQDGCQEPPKDILRRRLGRNHERLVRTKNPLFASLLFLKWIDARPIQLTCFPQDCESVALYLQHRIVVEQPAVKVRDSLQGEGAT